MEAVRDAATRGSENKNVAKCTTDIQRRFGTYLTKVPRLTFAHCESWEWVGERERRWDQKVESRPINLSAFIVRNANVHNRREKSLLYIYLNRKLIYLPQPPTGWNEKLPFFTPFPTIFNAEVSNRRERVRNSTFGYICTTSFPQS